MSQERQTAEAGRMVFIDALRGIAILLVMLHHAYARWVEVMPFHGRYADVTVFKYGYLGVQLFFVISGFVILMTLEKCGSFPEFIFRRWSRLFPAMLVCSLFIFFTASFLTDRPAGLPRWRDLLPGLSFIEPNFWQQWLGGSQGTLEGSFWSLFIEVKFYLVFGVLHSMFGGRIAVVLLTALYGLSCLDAIFSWSHLGASEFGKRLEWIGVRQYGWFAVGAWAYVYFRGKSVWIALVTVAVAIVTLKFSTSGVQQKMAALLLLSFLLPVIVEAIRNAPGISALAWLGFVSYPLYLLHENFLVALSIRLGKLEPSVPGLLLPVLPMTLVVGIAWLVAKYVEPLFHSRLKGVANQLR